MSDPIAYTTLIDINKKILNGISCLVKASQTPLSTPSGSITGTSCSTPNYTSLCELQQILDALNAIKVEVDGDVNVNLNQIEDLIAQTNLAIANNTAANNFAHDIIQPQDCGNNDIGAPKNVLNTVVLNTAGVKLCNIKEVVDAINQNQILPKVYNNVRHQLLDTPTSTITIPVNTIHSISWNVLKGTINITIDGVTIPYIQGETGFIEVDETINQVITFSPNPGGVIKLITIY